MSSTSKSIIGGISWKNVFYNSVVERGRRMIASAILFLLVWELASLFISDPMVLPSPVAVFDGFLSILNSGGPSGKSALFHLQKSLIRVVVAVVIAMSLAIVLGISMGTNQYVEDGLAFWLPLWMTIPTLAVVLITLIIFQFAPISVIIAVVFAATPFAIMNIWKAITNIEPEVIEMAEAFNLSKVDFWRHIYFPAILPSVFGSSRYLLGMVWKIVVLAEVFGVNNGLGSMFRFWYQQRSIVMLLSYLLIFIGIMFLIEYGILYPLERRSFRWRDS